MCDPHSFFPIGELIEGWQTDTSNKIRYYNTAKVQCTKCGKTYRAIQYKDKESNVSYTNWKIIEKSKCKHQDFVVDNTTKNAKAENTLKGLFSSQSKLQRQHSLIAKARCTTCFKFVDVKFNLQDEQWHLL